MPHPAHNQVSFNEETGTKPRATYKYLESDNVR